MTLKQFVDKYLNKKVDFDGAYGSQCVDLFRQYNKEVLGISQPKSVVGAADFWQNYDTDSNLKNNFTKVSNTPDGIPKAGDVMIWTRKYGPYGHIAIVTQADVNSFTCLSQNDPVGQPTISKTYKYVNVYGWLSPKVQVTQDSMTKTYTQEEWDKLRAENQDNWDKWKAETLTTAGLKEQLKLAQDKHQKLIEYIITKIAPLRAFIDQSEESAKGAIIELVSLVDTLNKTISENKKQAEKKEQELVKKNEDLQSKLDTLQAQFDKLKEDHARELETMQNRIDKVQEQVEANSKEVAENNKFKQFIKDFITKLLKG